MRNKFLVSALLFALPILAQAQSLTCQYSKSQKTETYVISGNQVISTTSSNGNEYTQTFNLFLKNARWLSFGTDHDEAEGLAVTLVDKQELSSAQLIIQWRGNPYALQPSPTDNGQCQIN